MRASERQRASGQQRPAWPGNAVTVMRSRYRVARRRLSSLGGIASRPSGTLRRMYPGAYVTTKPDKPAVIMASTGAVQTFAELDAAANRLSRLLRAAGRAPWRPRGVLHGEPPALPGGRVGLPLRRRHLHGGVVAPDERRARLHRCATARPRSSSPRRTRPTRRPRCSPHVPASTTWLMLDGVDRRLRVVRGGRRRPDRRPAVGPCRRPGHALLVRHDRAAQGRRPTVPARAAGDDGRPGARLAAAAVRRRPTVDVYLSPAPLYHAAPLRFCMSANGLGATVVVMEHFDAEEFLRLIERHRVTAHAGRADDVRAPAQAAAEDVRSRYDVSSLQCVIHAAAPCPVPGQAADDRVVRSGDPRVLRRHRGKRLRVLQRASSGWRTPAPSASR